MADQFTSEAEAISAASRTVLQRLTRLPDSNSASKVRELLQEHRHMLDSCTAELSSAVQKQLDDHKRALTFLHKANARKICGALEDLRSTGPNVANTQSFKPLVVAHNNLRAMLEVLRPLQNLEETVAELKRRLRDKSQISQVVAMGLQLSESKAQMMQLCTGDQAEVLADLFSPLTSFERDLSDSLWGVVENSLELVKTEPEAIVRVVRILGAHHTSDSIISHLELGISDRLAKLLAPSDSLDTLSMRTSEVLSDLQLIKDKLAPCFPAECQVYELCLRTYRKHIEGVMTPFLARSQEEETPGTIILLAAWLNDYITVLSTFSPDLIDDLQLQLISAKVKELMPDFVAHVESLLTDWIKRIISHDLQPDGISALVSSDSELISSLPEEMFSAISSQITFITTRIHGEILINVFRACCNVLKLQQSNERRLIQNLLESKLDSELAVPYLCMRINNMHRCSKHSTDLKEVCGKHLDFGDEGMNRERLDKMFAEVVKGYMAVATEATNALAVVIMRFVADNTIGAAFTEDWDTGRPVGTALTTFEDFSADLTKWLISDYYAHKIRRKFADLLLLAYIEKLLWTQTRAKDFTYKVLFDMLPALIHAKKPKEFKSLLATSFESLITRDSSDFEDFFQRNQLTLSYLPIFQALKALGIGGFETEIAGPAFESITTEGAALAEALRAAFSTE